MIQNDHHAADPDRNVPPPESKKKRPGGPFPTVMDPEPEPKGGETENTNDPDE
ncbi:MAG: hypothetical protein Tsb0020_10610 [Haliangiales bacterium]